MGSVKDLIVLDSPNKDYAGKGVFVFSDRYSVFDWGKMPDVLENKGKALALMAAYFFEKAEEEGIKTHYNGLVSSEDYVYPLDYLDEPSNKMDVKLVRVIHPVFEDGVYKYPDYSKMSNFLIPLEVIYRNMLPKGSSVFRRLKEGSLNYRDMGLDHYPVEGEVLNPPFFDVSTKLEPRDRYVSWREAQEISDLSDMEVNDIKDVLSALNDLISREVEKAGLRNEDGKIELAYGPDRKLMVVDVFGTPDECRWTYDGVQVNKQMLRDFYDNTEWARDVKKAKEEAKKQKIKDWKSLCNSEPPELDKDLKRITEQVYMSLANEITGRKFFEVPELHNLVDEYRYWVKQNKSI